MLLAQLLVLEKLCFWPAVCLGRTVIAKIDSTIYGPDISRYFWAIRSQDNFRYVRIPSYLVSGWLPLINSFACIEANTNAHTSLHYWNFTIGSSLVSHLPIGLVFIGPLHWNFPLVASTNWKLTLVTHIGSYWFGTIIIGTAVVSKRQLFHIGSDIRWLV